MPERQRTRFGAEEKEAILAELRASIGKRIRPLVAHLPPESVDELIDRMARIQYRYEGVGSMKRVRQ